jgi:hypothetical protein
MEQQTIKPTRYDWDSAWVIFLAGATMEETSEISGIPFQRVIEYSLSHNWKKQRAIAKEFAQKAIKNDLAKKLEQARIKHQSFMVDQLDETQTHIEKITIGTNTDAGEVHVMDKLAVLSCQHSLAAKVLSLDNQKPEDPNELGFAMLVAMSRASSNPIQALVTENQQTTYDLKGNEYQIMDELKPAIIPHTTSDNEPIPHPSISQQPTDPLAGILRPFNGHINSPTIPQNTPGIEIAKNPAYETASHEYNPATGAITARQPQPYQCPQPLVNENQTDSNGDQATDKPANPNTEGQEG